MGYNYRLTDLQAAVGIEQMKRPRLPGEPQNGIGDAIRPPLVGISVVPAPLYVPRYADPNFQSYAISLGDDCAVTRDSVWQTLLDNGVAAKRGIIDYSPRAFLH